MTHPAIARSTRALQVTSRIVTLLLCFLAFFAKGVAVEPDPNFHLYLLIGQSNMAGRGVLDAESKQAHPRVLMLGKDMKWEPATDPLHFDKPIAAVGPGLAFGRAMADANPAVKIGLIPCAMGGSKIEEWAPGTKNHTAMLARAREALKTGVLKGILWHQGEANVKDPSNYAALLQALIAGLRKEFNAPEVPFVAAEITAFKPDRDSIDRFNEILHAQSKHVAKYACVKTQDLKDKGDQLHYDTASARELGRRYATALLALQK
jgi:hypothetical protein